MNIPKTSTMRIRGLSQQLSDDIKKYTDADLHKVAILEKIVNRKVQSVERRAYKKENDRYTIEFHSPDERDLKRPHERDGS